MKRNFFSILLLSILTVPAIAQPRLTSNKQTHNFGQIGWKSPVSVEYIITNTGNKPLVLTNVTTSCACSVASWTQIPIAPGGKGSVTASFDAEALGRFEKSVAIYSNAEPSLVYLKFVGEVVREVTDFTNNHPYVIGSIHLDRTGFDFPDVHRGEKPSITFSVVNMSDRPYEPVLMHLPPYLKMTKKPDVLLKGKKGTVKLTLDSDMLTDLGLTQTSVYLARFSGDKVNEENEMPVSVVLLPSFAGMTESEKMNAPSLRLSEKEINFTAFPTRKTKVSRDIILTNTGKTPLRINMLQVSDYSLEVSLKKTILVAGESTRLRVTVHKNNVGNKKRPLRILMITNDPAQPKVVIDIKR